MIPVHRSMHEASRERVLPRMRESEPRNVRLRSLLELFGSAPSPPSEAGSSSSDPALSDYFRRSSVYTITLHSMPLTSTAPGSSTRQTPAKMSSTAPNQRRNGRNNGQDLNHVSYSTQIIVKLREYRELTRSPHSLQLLGFTLPPRSAPASAHLPRRSTKRTHHYGGFDRQRFVHQFRYVVKPDKGESFRPIVSRPLHADLPPRPTDRLHCTLCRPRYTPRLERYPPSHSPHFFVGSFDRIHFRNRSGRRWREWAERGCYTDVSNLLERANGSQDGEFSSVRLALVDHSHIFALPLCSAFRPNVVSLSSFPCSLLQDR